VVVRESPGFGRSCCELLHAFRCIVALVQPPKIFSLLGSSGSLSLLEAGIGICLELGQEPAQRYRRISRH
jgi:hypothetical protein